VDTIEKVNKDNNNYVSVMPIYTYVCCNGYDCLRRGPDQDGFLLHTSINYIQLTVI
jgi:hypothetical protein